MSNYVRQVKLKISDILDIRLDRLALCYDGKVLEDDRTLADSKVVPSNFLTVVVLCDEED